MNPEPGLSEPINPEPGLSEPTTWVATFDNAERADRYSIKVFEEYLYSYFSEPSEEQHLKDQREYFEEDGGAEGPSDIFQAELPVDQ